MVCHLNEFDASHRNIAKNAREQPAQFICWWADVKWISDRSPKNSPYWRVGGPFISSARRSTSLLDSVLILMIKPDIATGPDIQWATYPVAFARLLRRLLGGESLILFASSGHINLSVNCQIGSRRCIYTDTPSDGTDPLGVSRSPTTSRRCAVRRLGYLLINRTDIRFIALRRAPAFLA